MLFNVQTMDLNEFLDGLDCCEVVFMFFLPALFPRKRNATVGWVLGIV